MRAVVGNDGLVPPDRHDSELPAELERSPELERSLELEDLLGPRVRHEYPRGDPDEFLLVLHTPTLACSDAMAMGGCDLRARIRELMASGVLPKDPPVIQRSGRDSAWAAQQQTYAICAKADPVVTYFWPGGIVMDPALVPPLSGQ